MKINNQCFALGAFHNCQQLNKCTKLILLGGGGMLIKNYVQHDFINFEHFNPF